MYADDAPPMHWPIGTWQLVGLVCAVAALFVLL